MLNKNLLTKDVQDYIDQNLKKEPAQLILKGSPFKGIEARELVDQIKSKRKARKKLPQWFKRRDVIYPPEFNLSQASSEVTAQYKAQLIDGDNLLDVTGGMGVDDLAFAEKINVTHCEYDKNLSKLTAYNLKKFDPPKNIRCYSGDGLNYLSETAEKFDWVYADPSRRDDVGKKLFRLEDCKPDILENIGLMFSKSTHILLKTSPLLDISLAIEQLNYCSEVHIVAVRGEVKELLFILNKKAIHTDAPLLKTIHFDTQAAQYFNVYLNQGNGLEIEFSHPKTYLYEPNPALMKSGLFNQLAHRFKLCKLAPNTHLLTSDNLIEFPGRRFKVKRSRVFQRKYIKKLNLKKAHISCRNFPMSVNQLRKLTKLKDGGEEYLFFATAHDGRRLVVQTEKIR